MVQLISLPFITWCIPVNSPYLYGDLSTITGGLVQHRYFWKVKLISLPFLQYYWVTHHNYMVSSKKIPAVHFYVHFWEFNFILKSFITILWWFLIHFAKINIYCYIIYCHIYITQFLGNLFQGLRYYILFLFLSKISDSISAIHSDFKFIVGKIYLVEWHSFILTI